jgi:putative SOS response-associated peptidase YedK
MCGRFLLTTPAEALVELLGLDQAPEISPRFNIAPTQIVGLVRARALAPGREWVGARWGLVPHWAKEAAKGSLLINARAESVALKPAFREAFHRRRCLIPADGFYEWKQEGARRRPHVFRMRDGRPFAFAGLWERRQSPDSPAPLDSCAILTTGPNELLRDVHDRMPVILHPRDYAVWLDPTTVDAEALKELLQPYPAAEMTGHPVGPRVNNPRFDGPECIAAD